MVVSKATKSPCISYDSTHIMYTHIAITADASHLTLVSTHTACNVWTKAYLHMILTHHP